MFSDAHLGQVGLHATSHSRVLGNDQIDLEVHVHA